MDIKTYNHLPEEAKYIRKTVFVEEQGFNEEFDTTDNNCVHFVLFVEENAAATCRAFFDEESKSYHIGRVAVLKPFRGQGLGEKIMLAAHEYIKSTGINRVTLSAQIQASGFYEKLGYTKFGKEYLDEHCKHIMMENYL